ncbi:MAG: hypothetical protein IPP96_16915 [Chitinophagaceae bacterium]|nr:hypothetical protein [Chitinophagaceae bacterium]
MKNFFPSLKRYSLTFLLLFPMLFCFATTWYISPGGSDAAGNGTILSPWKTLYKATQTVITAGDIIHVNVGQKPIKSWQFIIKSSLNGDYVALLVASSPEGTNGNQHIRFKRRKDLQQHTYKRSIRWRFPERMGFLY